MHPVGPPPRKLVVAHPERKAQRALQRMVGATLVPVHVVDGLEGLHAEVDAGTIAIVDASLARAHPTLCERAAHAWIAVPGEGLAPAEGPTVEALLRTGWTHVVTHPMPLLAEELLATVQKLLRADVFGLEKYIVWGAEIRRYPLEDAAELEAAVSALSRDVVAVGLPERVGSLVSVIADELLSNALYVAPLDGAGRRFRAGDPRHRARPLTGRDAVTVRWATDARYLAVEVRDRWGSIVPGSVGAQLASGGRHASAATESGMGLPLVYACCNQLVIGCDPGELTEIITLLDVRYKPTEIGRKASFHTFTGRLGVAAD